MYILIRYILLLIMSCLPAISMQNREIINREQQSIHKDSVSEIVEPVDSSKEIFCNQSRENEVLYACDSTNIENIEWKFRKQIILGN